MFSFLNGTRVSALISQTFLTMCLPSEGLHGNDEKCWEEVGMSFSVVVVGVVGVVFGGGVVVVVGGVVGDVVAVVGGAAFVDIGVGSAYNFRTCEALVYF